MNVIFIEFKLTLRRSCSLFLLIECPQFTELSTEESLFLARSCAIGVLPLPSVNDMTVLIISRLPLPRGGGARPAKGYQVNNSSSSMLQFVDGRCLGYLHLSELEVGSRLQQQQLLRQKGQLASRLNPYVPYICCQWPATTRHTPFSLQLG